MSAAGAPPEIRIDQLTGLRVVLAPGRAERPDAFEPAAAEPAPGAAERCPFCEGREDRTPPEVWADRPEGEADAPGWRTRSVPNLYPVLTGAEGDGPAHPGSGFSSPGDPLGAATRSAEPDQFRAVPAEGVHEVIVSSPGHATSLLDLDPDQFEHAVEAWRARIAAHAGSAAYCHLIVNEGPLAGASLEHSHAQLYALPFVPAEVARERERFTAYHERTMGGHLLLDIATQEVRRRERLVAIDDEAMLICPWASRSPFEMRVIPREATAGFGEGGGGAEMLRRALEGLREVFGALPQYNLWVRTAPRGGGEFHWHIDIVPRLTIRAGFELGTGVDINVYAPERAASDLRDALG